MKIMAGNLKRRLVLLALGLSAVSFLVFFLRFERSGVRVVESRIVAVDSISQISLLTDTLVEPVLYTNISGLDKVPLKEAKKIFISAVLPSILVAKHNIEMQRLRIAELDNKVWSHDDSVLIDELKLKYQAKSIEDLKLRIGTLPTSIVLAQAAVETGWGRSRFFEQASNVFGVWSMDSTEARIPAFKKRRNKTIYLRHYKDISVSVNDYFEVLSRARSYRTLRKARLETNDPYKLLPYLKSYSERKSAYTRLLKKIIDQNNLTQYDRYQIDPDFLVYP